MLFDADDPDDGLDGLPTACEVFAAAIADGLIPAAVPVLLGDGEVTVATISFGLVGRPRETAMCPDPDVRCRLAVGLIAVAKTRVANALSAAEGTAPI